MFLAVLEFALYALIFVVVASEVIIPLIRGTILFPTLRSATRGLTRQKKQLLDKVEASHLKEEIDQLKSTLQDQQPKEKSCGPAQSSD